MPEESLNQIRQHLVWGIVECSVSTTYTQSSWPTHQTINVKHRKFLFNGYHAVFSSWFPILHSTNTYPRNQIKNKINFFAINLCDPFFSLSTTPSSSSSCPSFVPSSVFSPKIKPSPFTQKALLFYHLKFANTISCLLSSSQEAWFHLVELCGGVCWWLLSLWVMLGT